MNPQIPLLKTTTAHGLIEFVYSAIFNKMDNKVLTEENKEHIILKLTNDYTPLKDQFISFEQFITNCSTFIFDRITDYFNANLHLSQPFNFDQVTNKYRLIFFLKNYRYDEEHMRNSSHVISHKSNFVKNKSIITNDKWFINFITPDQNHILNVMDTITSCEFNYYNNNNIDYVYITIYKKNLDIRNKCWTNDHTIQINHKKKSYHLYPDNKTSNISQITEEACKNIETCKEFFITNIEIFDPAPTEINNTSRIPFGEILDELQKSSLSITPEFLKYFLDMCITTPIKPYINKEGKIASVPRYEDNEICNVKYKNPRKDLIDKRIKYCVENKSKILNLSGLNIGEFNRNIPDHVSCLNLSHNNFRSLKSLKHNNIKEYVITANQKLIKDSYYTDKPNLYTI